MTKEDFFKQDRSPISAVSDNCEPYLIYRQNDTNQIIYEFVVNAGIDETVEIGMVSDIHFNYANEKDLDDEEICDTLQNRIWLKDGESVPSAVSALKGASLLDQTVVCGDTLDFLSNGAMDLMRKHVFEPYPNAICVLGGHELTKQMQTGKPDRLPLKKRIKILEDFWCHDAHYYSRLLKDKVLCVGVDNSTGHYHKSVAKKLKKDLRFARKNGYVVLIFQHEPINTYNPNYKVVDAILVGDPSGARRNAFDSKDCIGSPLHDDRHDKKVLSLILNNADVVKGVFAGHWHNLYYLEINAVTKNGTPSTIPQVVVPSNAYSYDGSCGQITRIIVK